MPHFLFHNGITIRIELVTHNYQTVPPSALTIKGAYADNKGQEAISDIRVKLSDIKLHTSEIIPSAEYK